MGVRIRYYVLRDFLREFTYARPPEFLYYPRCVGIRIGLQ